MSMFNKSFLFKSTFYKFRAIITISIYLSQGLLKLNIHYFLKLILHYELVKVYNLCWLSTINVRENEC